MTRLRIKTADGKIERMTVPDDSTLRELKETIAKDLLQNTSTTQVKLSLNKKVLNRWSLRGGAEFKPIRSDLTLCFLISGGA